MTASSKYRGVPGASGSQAESTCEELESIYRSAPVGLSFIDRDLRYLRVNQAIAAWNGCSIEEMIGKTYRDLSPETADTAEPFLRALMAQEEPVRNLEVRSRPPTDPDVERVYLLSMDRVNGANGELIGHVTAVQDVTELRRAEESAARRLGELELLYAHTPVGLCFMSLNLDVIHTNSMFSSLCRVPIQDHLGTNVENLLRVEWSRQLLPQLRYVTRSGSSSVTLEIRGPEPDGGPGERTLLAQTHAAHSSDGSRSGIITVLQNITSLARERHEIATERDRLVEAQHVAKLGSWEWDLIGGEVWWSPELYEIFGEGQAYIPSYEGFIDRVNPADRQNVREQLDEALTGEDSRWMTFRILLSDASEKILFTAARLERNESGIAAKLVGTCQDVTDFGSIRNGIGER